VDKIDLKKIKEFISEALVFVKDIPLFLTKGKAYFSKIAREDLEINLFRMATYIVVSVLLQICLLLPKLNVDYNPLIIAGILLLQLPIVAIGYLIALLFTDVRSKIKTCLNYVVFQQMITLLFPFFFLTLFIYTENYLFYYLHTFSLIVFCLYTIMYFAWLFQRTWLKRILSLLIVVGTIFAIGFAGSNLGFDKLRKQSLLLAFEDPIATEFFSYDCYGEVNEVVRVVKVNESKRINESMLKIMTNIINDEFSDKVELNLELEKISNFAYERKLVKEKEYKYIENKMKVLGKKAKDAKFDNTKNILNESLEIYRGYNNYLIDFDKTLLILSDMNTEYLMGHKIKLKANLPKQMPSEITNVIERIEEVKTINYYMGRVILAAKAQIQSAEKIIELQERVGQLVPKTVQYVELITKIERLLPIYQYRIIPFNAYEFE